MTATAPDLALGWYNLGLIQRQCGALAEAIAAYQRAIALAPGHAESHQNLAAACLLVGDIDAARRGFRQAIALLHAQGRTSEAGTLAARAGKLVRLDTP